MSDISAIFSVSLNHSLLPDDEVYVKKSIVSWVLIIIADVIF